MALVADTRTTFLSGALHGAVVPCWSQRSPEPRNYDKRDTV
jgi:hypothetical protein